MTLSGMVWAFLIAGLVEVAGLVWAWIGFQQTWSQHREGSVLRALQPYLDGVRRSPGRLRSFVAINVFRRRPPPVFARASAELGVAFEVNAAVAVHRQVPDMSDPDEFVAVVRDQFNDLQSRLGQQESTA